MHSESLATRQGFRYSVPRVCHQQLQRGRLSIFPAPPRMKTVLAIHFFFPLFSSPRKFEIFSAKFSRHPVPALTHCPPPRSSIFSSGLALMNPPVIMVPAVIAADDTHSRRSSLQEKWISMLTQKAANDCA